MDPICLQRKRSGIAHQFQNFQKRFHIGGYLLCHKEFDGIEDLFGQFLLILYGSIHSKELAVDADHGMFFPEGFTEENQL